MPSHQSETREKRIPDQSIKRKKKRKEETIPSRYKKMNKNHEAPGLSVPDRSSKRVADQRRRAPGSRTPNMENRVLGKIRDAIFVFFQVFQAINEREEASYE